MREIDHTRRLDTSDDLYIEFVDELKEPFGSVRMRAEQTDSKVICRAEWGGWSWRAEGQDRLIAQQRLNDRLARLDPFEQGDGGWGSPGHQVGPLDDSIPPGSSRRMREYTYREARNAMGLLEAVMEAQARRPWAFPAADDEIALRVEVEGYVGADGSLALFPRTFYEIAGSYFGRSATDRLRRAGVGQPGARLEDSTRNADDPGLAGALRRLSERGYMSQEDGRLAHQLHPIEVYVFRARPRDSGAEKASPAAL